jgi:hypothetical protein
MSCETRPADRDSDRTQSHGYATCCVPPLSALIFPGPSADEIRHATEQRQHRRAASRKTSPHQGPCQLAPVTQPSLPALSGASAAVRRTARRGSRGQDHSLSGSRQQAPDAQAAHAGPSRSFVDAAGTHHVPSLAALSRRTLDSGCYRSARHPIHAAQRSARMGCRSFSLCALRFPRPYRYLEWPKQDRPACRECLHTPAVSSAADSRHPQPNGVDCV